MQQCLRKSQINSLDGCSALTGTDEILGTHTLGATVWPMPSVELVPPHWTFKAYQGDPSDFRIRLTVDGAPADVDDRSGQRK